MIVFRWMLLILPAIELAGQTQQTIPIQVRPQVVGRPIRDGQVTTVYLAPRYATAIRMPEPVNSVVVGDPGSFSAEHSDREPQLVFVKPITPKPAQTNLLISTTRGLQVSLLLVSRGETKGDGECRYRFPDALQAVRAIHHPAGRVSVSRCPSDCHPRHRFGDNCLGERVRPGYAQCTQNGSLRTGSCNPTVGRCQRHKGGARDSR